MSDEQAPPEVTDLGEIPATQPSPEDTATLSLRYVEGVPALVVNGATTVPETIIALDGSGTPVAAYTAGPVAKVSARTVNFHVQNAVEKLSVSNK